MHFKKLALVGNPNSGKSTIFNQLTGMNQKVGNFPGVTVEGLEGNFLTFQGDSIRIFDLPGAYSVFTASQDEKVLSQALTHPDLSTQPEAVIYVADFRYMHQHLLLLTQVIDLEYPVFIVLTNLDQVNQEIADKWCAFLKEKTSCEVVPFSSRLGYTGINLREKLNQFIYSAIERRINSKILEMGREINPLIQNIPSTIQVRSNYHAFLLALDDDFCRKNKFVSQDRATIIRHQIDDTVSRYSIIEQWESQIKYSPESKSNYWTKKLDNVLTHSWWGLIIFLILFFLIFQMIYSWAEFPMNAIEDAFAYTSETIKSYLPESWWSSLIINGIIPGLAGVLVFIPQIAILFIVLSILEEAGYMTRVVYLLDHLLTKFGLNGRSIIGLISGGACAIPAIMSTRTIFNSKERLLSMFVIPLIPCSARIPVYTALIGFVVSPVKIFGIFNLPGLVFMGLYLLGITMAFITAYVANKIIKNEGNSILIMQLPNYQVPSWRSVLVVVFQKVKSFVLEAGKIIMIISVVLWFLASFSFSGEFEHVESEIKKSATYQNLGDEEKSNLLEAKKLEHSFAGKFGRFIEPAIKPLGFDWKIGIALITSFAAREVFVGTMSTIYSIGSESDELKLRQVLAAEKREDGTTFFNARTALSLIIFYAFALQCMSTMAVMKKESGGWKIPILQFLVFGLLAYISSFIIYNFLPF